MSIVTEPPVMREATPIDVIGQLQRPYDLLHSFFRAHEAIGLDPAQCFDQLWTNGVVYKTPDLLVLGGPDLRRPDAWWVWWAQRSPDYPVSAVSAFLKAMPYFRPYVGWSRRLRGRNVAKYYSTKRLQQLTRHVDEFV